MLCNICETIFAPDHDRINLNVDGGETPHHRTYRSFKCSFELGCYICNGIWATLDSDERNLVSASPCSSPQANCDEPVESFVTSTSLEDGERYGRPRCYLLQVAFSSRAAFALEKPKVCQYRRGYWRASFVLLPCDGRQRAVLKTRLPESTNSAETLSLADSWIAGCVANHQECSNKAKTGDWYPTRLLDCGVLRTSEKCRLIYTGSSAVSGPYMTLSHRWGTADCLKLTSDNHAQLLDEISLSQLPQLYQDAVCVTRGLGIRYLWIDSLCIIQRGDEFADCRHELMVMDKVYSHSLCNISAADAPNGLHSMFCTRDPITLYPQTVSLAADGHVAAPYTLCDSTFWELEVSEAPLNRRAWVLQERLLAPRVLHFARTQIHWECRNREACEVYPDGLPIPLLGSSHSRFKDLDPHDHVGKNQAQSILARYQVWTRIVQAYTACDLTFSGDKLVALSAVARVMASLLEDDYVAGMWRRFLERELLWSVGGNRIKNTYPSRPTTYRAPSWSWASVNGRVNPGLPEVDASDVLIEVEGVHVDHTTENRFGPLEGGWLRLRGVLKQLALLPHSPATGIYHGDWNMVINGVPVSVPSDSVRREPQPHVMLDAPYDNFSEQNAEEALYCMPARAREGDEGSIYVLILELHNREQSMFRRIGIARGWGKEMKEMILAHSADESRFPCEAYRDGRHSIHII